jgi:starch phosphorylase
MAYLAIRGSGSANGVSRLHGEVSRRLFRDLFSRFPEHEVPIGHVTNGIHVPTWDSAGADRLWTDVCGKGLWRGDLADVTSHCEAADDISLWQMRGEGRRSLVEYARDRFARQEAGHGASTLQLQLARSVLDPDTLTFGFARRFATYKRPTLLLHDRDRLARILTNPQAPAQLVVAGKAHPKDLPGQALIREWIEFASRPDVSSHVIFLSDHDMLLAERLMEGVDVWINTPRRPWEASGTSGMKVLVNGGLNFSVLDGWWSEACSPEVGWAIGDGQEHGDDPEWDRRDADAMYAVLENEIVPAFYSRDEAGIPRAWVARIRKSMARLTPIFSANRTVRQYTEEHYLPAASAYTARASHNGTGAGGLLGWRSDIDRYWRDVRFGKLRTYEQEGELTLEAELHLAGLEPSAVRVELYAEAEHGGAPIRHEMHTAESRVGDPGLWIYSTRIATSRPSTDFTPRVLPYHSSAMPLEIDHVVWQK